MEESGFFSMAAYDFEYEPHAISFTDSKFMNTSNLHFRPLIDP